MPGILASSLAFVVDALKHELRALVTYQSGYVSSRKLNQPLASLVGPRLKRHPLGTRADNRVAYTLPQTETDWAEYKWL